MAQRRMISKSISTSTKLAEVSNFSKLLFTWTVPHCDDYGHMDGSARIVKGIVVPLCEEGTEEVEDSLVELEKVGLITRYEIDGKKYLEIEKWLKHQTLKNERPLNIIYPLPKNWNPKMSKRKNKRREEKLREDKIYTSLTYLSDIPTEDIKEFKERFIITEKQLKSKAEDLKLYCERKGRVYKNYKSFLLNAIKKDFREKEEEKAMYQQQMIQKVEENIPLTKEQKENLEIIKQDIAKIAGVKRI